MPTNPRIPPTRGLSGGLTNDGSPIPQTEGERQERQRKVEELGRRFKCGDCGKKATMPGHDDWNGDNNQNLTLTWDKPGDLIWCSDCRDYYCSDCYRKGHSNQSGRRRKKFLGIF